MIISSPDHIELRKVFAEGPNTSNRCLRFVFEGVGEYKLKRGEVILMARVQVVSYNYALGYRTYDASIIPHNTVTVLTRFYDYLMDTLKDLADEILDVHYSVERLI